MKLKDQVVSLKLSKQLKELGFEQESLFKWHSKVDAKGNLTHTELVYFPEGSLESDISAYTVAELGEMLPEFIKSPKWAGRLELPFKDSCWVYFQPVVEKSKEDLATTTANTEADARAKLLIYLKENNLI